MTAWSDAITAATTVAGTKAAALAADAGDAHAGRKPVRGTGSNATVATYYDAIRTQGLALYAADPSSAGRVQAGLADAGLNGWVGRPTGVSGAYDILGFSLAGDDYVTYPLEVGQRQSMRVGGGPD